MRVYPLSSKKKIIFKINPKLSLIFKSHKGKRKKPKRDRVRCLMLNKYSLLICKKGLKNQSKYFFQVQLILFDEFHDNTYYSPVTELFLGKIIKNLKNWKI
ncbi:hypothetical protein ABPG72_003249 [Tetrahymena utriculariae]